MSLKHFLRNKHLGISVSRCVTQTGSVTPLVLSFFTYKVGIIIGVTHRPKYNV